MQLLPFDSSQASDVFSMLDCHLNLTPETTDDQIKEIFTEFYVQEMDCGIYLVLQNNEGVIVAFVGIKKDRVVDNSESWYLTDLFVTRDSATDLYVDEVLRQLRAMICPIHALFVNIHPAAKEAISFWTDRQAHLD